MKSFVALIVPLGEAPGGGGSPPGIWGPTDPRPTPPIHMPPQGGGGSPPGIWGGGNVPMPTPPIANVPGAPGYQPPSGGVPTHPIYYPPGIWGPTDPRPGWGLPGQPPQIWGGANQPFPTPPIVIPAPPPPYPEAPPDAVKPPPEEGGWGYHEDYGWMYLPPPGSAPSPKK